MDDTPLPLSPRICIVGAGAIGGLFGVRMAQAGAQVSVLARGATLQAIRSQGWTLQHDGTASTVHVAASDDAAALGPQDVVLTAVKAFALPGVAAQVAAMLGPRTVVVPALNGVPWWFTDPAAGLPVRAPLARLDPDGELARHLPVARVIGGVVYPACSTPAPGVAKLHSGSRVVFGEAGRPAGSPASQRLQDWVALLQRAGFEAEASGDIRTEAWKKLLGNACFNPVSLLTGSPTDRMIDDPEVYALFVAMMGEVLAVGRAMGVDAAIEPPARLAITRKLGNVKTSMLQDAEAGRPVEIDAILGAVADIASALDVAAPHCRAVLAMAQLRARALLPAQG